MPDILVRDVDATALSRLEERAKGNGRSLGAELRIILEQASRRDGMLTALISAERMTRRLEGRPHTDSSQLLRDDRLR